MRRALRLLLLLVVAFIPANAIAQCVGNITDDFAGGSLAPLWMDVSGGNGNVAESGGRLVMSKTDGVVGAATCEMAPPNELCGDFDITVDFDLGTFPAAVSGSGRFHSIMVLDYSSGALLAGAERYREQANGCVPFTDSYKFYTTIPGCNGDAIYVSSGDQQGRLRLARQGTTIRGYYWDGASWAEAMTRTIPDSPIRVAFSSGTNGSLTSGHVAYFDNLTIQSTNGLVLWLNADVGVHATAGAVSQWDDQSGQSHDALQSNPSSAPLLVPGALNGHSVIRFDGVDDNLGLTGTSPMTQVTFCIVSKLVAGATGNAYYPIVLGGDANVSGQYYGIETRNALSASSEDVADIFGGFSNDARATVSEIGAFDQWNIIVGRTDQFIGNTSVRSNGADASIGLTGSNVPISIQLGNSTGTGWGGVGGTGNGAPAPGSAKCDIAEVLVYDGILSDAEVLALEGSLSSKYGIPSPSVVTISPSMGGSFRTVTVSISGKQFMSGASVKLSRTAQPDIVASGIAVSTDGRSLMATFDLTSAVAGVWDVTVQNPNGLSGILSSGFTVTTEEAPALRVDVLGPTRIRSNRLTAFDIVIQNPGNTDALAVPLWLTGIPSGATVQLGFSPAPAPQDPGDPDWSQVPLAEASGGMQSLALVIPRVPPGATVRRFSISSPVGFQLGVAVTPSWKDGAVLRACLHDGGVIENSACMGSHLSVVSAFITGTPGLLAVGGAGLWSKIAFECEGAGSLSAAEAKAGQILNYLARPLTGLPVAGSCGDALRPIWQAALKETVVTSVDPSAKLGPSGLISKGELLTYSIRFENDQQFASADAQQVTVLDALDPTTLNWSTASMGPITFGFNPATHEPYTVVPLEGATNYRTRVDLRPARDLIVLVGTSIDRETGHVSWSFDSVDSVGQTPPLIGFLPPDVTPPEGEGSVVIKVETLKTLTAGTNVANQATITFDGNAMTPPAWANSLVDTMPPESHMLPLPAGEDSAIFTVRWEALNAPPDLRDFTIYAAEDGGTYWAWKKNTIATADTFASRRGHAYAFYSQARDESGNIEPAHLSPDAQTLAPTSVGEEGSHLELRLDGSRPNPARGALHVAFTLPSRSRATLELIDIAGRRVVRREVESLGPGPHVVDLGLSQRLGPGLYFVRLAQQGRVRVARVALVP